MWLTHLEFDATKPFIRHWFDAMGERGRYVRYDARGYGLSDPGARAEQVQAAFLPDVVTYQPGQAASFQPGSGNGRALDDNTFDIAVAVLAGSTLGNASVPRPPTSEFHYQRPGRRSCRPSPTCSASASRDRSNRTPAGCPRLRRRPCGPASAGSDVARRYRASASSRWHACAWRSSRRGVR